MTCAAPEEGCALLLGRRGSPHGAAVPWHGQRIWPCLNTWPEPAERRRRFAIDPREQLLAQKWARQRGLAVLGAAHSHPSGQAVPSPTDCALTLAPALMLILAADGDLAAWWLDDTDRQPQPLPWRMDA
ncbi:MULTISPECIES: M67 family metallopeptidase [Aphanothece]|uniref:M67 family metallopeptidase n=1 Tax=Aphanothece TaxID=1121 RepID=UPI00398E963A